MSRKRKAELDLLKLIRKQIENENIYVQNRLAARHGINVYLIKQKRRENRNYTLKERRREVCCVLFE